MHAHRVVYRMLQSTPAATPGGDDDQLRASLRQSSLKNSVVAWLLVEGRLPDRQRSLLPPKVTANSPPPIDLSKKHNNCTVS